MKLIGMRMLKFSALLACTALVSSLLSGCADQQSATTDQAHHKLDGLVAISKPEPTTMEADVAELMSAAWAELQSALQQDVSDKQASAQHQAKAYADFGLVAYGNGVLLPAQQAFDNAVLLAPEDARWIYFRALMHQAAGELEQAASGFEKVLELRPDDTPTRLRLANVRFEQSQPEQARKLFQAVIAEEPDQAAALYGLGRVASSAGDHELAVEYFERALELQPYADRIYYPLALSLRSLDLTDRAKQAMAQRGTNEPYFTDPLFDQISGGQRRLEGLWANMNAGSQAFVDGNFQQAVEEFKKATANHPDDPRAWQSLGMGLNQTGDAQGAINAYTKALSLDDNNAVVHHTLAQLKIAAGLTEEAEDHLLAAIDIDPRMIEAHLTLAELLTDMGRDEDAMRRFESARALDPQSSKLAVAKANSLVALGRTEEAAQSLADTLEANPKDAELRTTYAVLQAELGNLESAQSELAIALDAARDDLSKGRVRYAQGTVLVRQGLFDPAIQAFGEALRLNPRHNAAGLELARTFLRQRDLKQALAAYKVHIELWPASDETRIEAARVALMMGDGEDALKLLKDGLTHGADSARLLGSLARLLVLTTDAALRDPAAAMQYAELALEKSSSFTHLETLALVHSASDDFQAALTVQQQAQSQITIATPEFVKNRIAANIQRYRGASLGRLPLDAR